MFGFLQDCCQTRGFDLFSSVKTEIEVWIESQVWNPNKYLCSDPKNEQPTNEKLNSSFTLIAQIRDRLYVSQRSYQRLLDKSIYRMEMKFCAVLGTEGYWEKKLPTAISMQLFGVFFSTFCGQKNIFKLKKKDFSIRTLHNI